MLKAWSLTSTSATGINFNASSVATGENMYFVAYQDGKALLYNDVEALMGKQQYKLLRLR